MGKAEIEYIRFDDHSYSSKQEVGRFESSITKREKVAVRDVITSLGKNAVSGQKCTIRYHTGDGKSKSRTLEPGQSFNFAYDIFELAFDKYSITSESAYSLIFKYMDTTGQFTVEEDMFGKLEGPKPISNIRIKYWRPDDRECNQTRQIGQIFKFSDTNGIERPDPNKCRCPCPVCAKQHLTDEQRKEQEDQRRQEESKRQTELDELKDAVKRAQELAETAAKEAKSAGQGVRETKADVENIYREIADIRAVLGNLPTGGKQDISPLFKVCIVSSQILALVVLGAYVWRGVVQGKRV